MNNKAATFFDDTIKALSIEAESAKFANVKPEILSELYSVSGVTVPTPQTQSVQDRQTTPTQQQGQNSNNAQQARPTPSENGSPNVQQQTTAPIAQGMSPADIVAISKMDIAKIERSLKTCNRCSLYAERKNPVVGAGNPTADLMFIGEAPGRDEDEQGIPFMGEAGQLLTKMINAMQFSRSEVYITNIIKCRPPKSRNPEQAEAEACMEFLKQQIKLIQPKVIVTLGALPLQYLMNKRGITQCRGEWMDYNGIKVMPTFHPEYLLRVPLSKKEVWNDLQQVMQFFEKSNVHITKR